MTTRQKAKIKECENELCINIHELIEEFERKTGRVVTLFQVKLVSEKHDFIERTTNVQHREAR